MPEFFLFVTISLRHSSRRMRFGRRHSPTQREQPSNPLLSAFLLRPDKYLEWASSPPPVVEDRNLFQIRHVESAFLSNTSRFGFTWPTFHTALTCRLACALHVWLTQQVYCRARCYISQQMLHNLRKVPFREWNITKIEVEKKYMRDKNADL